MSFDANEIRTRMQMFCIPPFALSTTLELLGQHALRRIITDRAFRRKGERVSFIVARGGTTPSQDFNQAFGRFCAELIMQGEEVQYMPMSRLAGGMRRYYAGAADSPLPSSFASGGYLAVPDFSADEKNAEVLDYLLEFVSQGNGILLADNPNVRPEGFLASPFGTLFRSLPCLQVVK